MSQLKTIQDENLPIWLPRLAVHGGPRFLQIADALQAAVVDGSLKPGDRLPPQRQLSSIAKRCNVRIVEDDPYWLLADAPPPPIATFAGKCA